MDKVDPEALSIFMGGTGGRRPASVSDIASTVTAALPALTASLALDLAPVRVNLTPPASSTDRSRHGYQLEIVATAHYGSHPARRRTG